MVGKPYLGTLGFQPIILPLNSGILHVVDDEHFMFATDAREAGRPNRAPASG
jgi:hypothetical protein